MLRAVETQAAEWSHDFIVVKTPDSLFGSSNLELHVVALHYHNDICNLQAARSVVIASCAIVRSSLFVSGGIQFPRERYRGLRPPPTPADAMQIADPRRRRALQLLVVALSSASTIYDAIAPRALIRCACTRKQHALAIC